MKTATDLHDAIMAVCPINRISVGILGDNSTVTFQSTVTATDVQKTTAQSVINAFDWSTPKQDAYEAAVAIGYPVSPEGFTLPLDEVTRGKLAELMTLINTALAIGSVQLTDTTQIQDAAGTMHSVTFDRLRQILVGYGLRQKQLWDALNA